MQRSVKDSSVAGELLTHHLGRGRVRWSSVLVVIHDILPDLQTRVKSVIMTESFNPECPNDDVVEPELPFYIMDHHGSRDKRYSP